jgi:hypothetical protein
VEALELIGPTGVGNSGLWANPLAITSRFQGYPIPKRSVLPSVTKTDTASRRF